MKRTRVVLGAVLVSSVFWLVGCGQGTYRIPAVEPVVKPKPENDLLEDIEGGDKTPSPAESKPSTPAPPAEKAPEPKPAAPAEEAKPEAAKPAETAKPEADASKAAKAPAKAGAKPADAKPGKPAKGKK